MSTRSKLESLVLRSGGFLDDHTKAGIDALVVDLAKSAPVRGVGAFERLRPGMRVRHESGRVGVVTGSAGYAGVWIDWGGSSSNTHAEDWRLGRMEIVDD